MDELRRQLGRDDRLLATGARRVFRDGQELGVLVLSVRKEPPVNPERATRDTLRGVSLSGLTAVQSNIDDVPAYFVDGQLKMYLIPTFKEKVIVVAMASTREDARAIARGFVEHS